MDADLIKSLRQCAEQSPVNGLYEKYTKVVSGPFCCIDFRVPEHKDRVLLGFGIHDGSGFIERTEDLFMHYEKRWEGKVAVTAGFLEYYLHRLERLGFWELSDHWCDERILGWYRLYIKAFHPKYKRVVDACLIMPSAAKMWSIQKLNRELEKLLGSHKRRILRRSNLFSWGLRRIAWL